MMSTTTMGLILVMLLLDSESVVVPNNPVKFSRTDLRTLQLNVNPLSASDNYGIDFYEQTLQIILTFNQI